MQKDRNRNFKGYPKQAIAFFKGIHQNNNKAWFEPHKQDYINYCVKPTWDLINDLVPAMLKIDPGFATDPKKMISRIYRDIRFSKDKSPYKARLWFTFRHPGKDQEGRPGYYFEIAHDSYGFGMGAYDAPKEYMAAFRQAITRDPGEFLRTIAFLKKDGNEFILGGDSYKRPPKEHVDERLLKWYMMKNFYLYCDRPIDKVLFSPGLADDIKKGYNALASLYRYLWKVRQ